MPQMTGGQALVAGMRQAGVTTLFGIPGVHNGGLYDALLDAPEMRVVITRHEQGAAFMADGYARASGRVACVATITGPGITNAATGLGEAYAESSPVLHIATALGPASRTPEAGELHELRDQSGVLRALVGHHELVETVPAIPGAVTRAMEVITTDRPGPASVEIPLDLLIATDEVALDGADAATVSPPDSDVVDRAAELLAKAEAPLIFLGSGAMDAGSEVEALAERLQAPVLTAQTGKGAFPESHPLSLGCKHRLDESLYELLRTRDVALVVGCRLGARVTDDDRMPLPETLIQVDRSAAELGRHRENAVSIQADAAAAVSELLEALPDEPPPEAPNIAEGMRARRRNPHDAADDPRSADILAELRRVLPENGVLVNDMTMTSYRSAGLFPVDQPRSYMFPIYFGTLGFSLPAAIGAQVACPERPVLSLSGDGGFLFTAEELATAVREQLPVVAVVFNDSSYAAIDGNFRGNFGGRTVDVRLHNPDFVAFGKSFGAAAEGVDTPEALGAAVERGLARRCPTLIEYKLPPVG